MRGKTPLPAAYCLRGNRHDKNLWQELLPSVKQKLVEAGLFDKDGNITELGKQTLKDMD